MYGLLDCTSFYASCERLFRPDLEGRPIAVLSNNDGCLISMSKEVKKTGLEIGSPYFKNRALLKKINTAVFSANFALYGDISSRIMHTLRSYVEQVEVYSIDEAFFCISDELGNLAARVARIRSLVMRQVGVPVRIGMGSTMTLAKLANSRAKQSSHGTCCLLDRHEEELALRDTPVRNIWGIGRRLTARLEHFNVVSAYDFCQMPADAVRSNLGGACALRTQQELLGISCLSLARAVPARQSLIHSRTFPKAISSRANLRRHAREFTARAAERLRSHNLRAGALALSLSTDKHGDGDYLRQKDMAKFANRSNDTMKLADAAAKLAMKLAQPGQSYKRLSITLLDLSADRQQQLGFEDGEHLERDMLWRAIDSINSRYGRNTVRCGWGGFRQRQELLSPRYTTRREDICKVR